MRNLDENTITDAVLARHAESFSPRLKEIMTSLVTHLHAFARDVRLTESEWVHHEEGRAPDGTRMETAFSTLEFDFVLS